MKNSSAPQGRPLVRGRGLKPANDTLTVKYPCRPLVRGRGLKHLLKVG